MPTKQSLTTAIVVMPSSDQPTNQLHLFGRGGLKLSFSEYIQKFSPTDPLMGTLSESNLYFKQFSPTPPPDSGASVDPNQLSRELIETLLKSLDDLADECQSFDKRVYAEEQYEELLKEKTTGQSLAIYIGADKQPRAAVGQAQLPVSEKGKKARAALEDALRENSLARKMFQFAAIDAALKIADDCWTKDLKFPAKFLGENKQRRFRWLYSVISRQSVMEDGDSPSNVDPVVFEKKIKEYLQGSSVQLQSIQAIDAKLIEDRIKFAKARALEILRAKRFVDDKGVLPDELEAEIVAWVRAACGQADIDPLYLARMVRDALTNLAAVSRGGIEEASLRGLTQAEAWRRGSGERVPTESEVDEHTTRTSETYLKNPQIAAENSLSRLVACATLDKQDQNVKALCYGLMVPLLNDETSPLRNELQKGQTEIRPLLTSAQQGRLGLPAPEKKKQEKKKQEDPLVGELRLAAPSDENAISTMMASRGTLLAQPRFAVANWIAGAHQVASASAGSDFDRSADDVPTGAGSARAALRLLYFALLMRTQGVKFDKPADKAVGVFAELLRYGSFEKMLAVVPLSRFCDCRTLESLRDAYENATAECGDDTFQRLSHLYGVQALFRSCQVKDVRIGIFDGTAEEFKTRFLNSTDDVEWNNKFSPSHLSEDKTNCLPFCVYFTDLAFGSRQEKSQFIQTLPANGLLVAGEHVRPLPPLLFDAGPDWWEKVAMQRGPWMKDLPSLEDKPYAAYAGPGLRFRGNNNGDGRVPLIPATYFVLAALLEGDQLGYSMEGTATLASTQRPSTALRFDFRQTDDALIGKDPVDIAEILVRWSTDIKRNKELAKWKAKQPFGPVLFAWSAILDSHATQAPVQLSSAGAEGWPFAVPMPKWAHPGTDLKLKIVGVAGSMRIVVVNDKGVEDAELTKSAEYVLAWLNSAYQR